MRGEQNDGDIHHVRHDHAGMEGDVLCVITFPVDRAARASTPSVVTFGRTAQVDRYERRRLRDLCSEQESL